MSTYYIDRSAQHKKLARYVLPYIIGFFILLTAGQIAGEFYTINQLNKASGKIVDLQTKIISWTHHKGGHSTPDYALVITLNNGSAYNVEDTRGRKMLSTLLHNGDNVVIYYPTMLLKILNASFVHAVNQIEISKQVVYSFDEQKKENWMLAVFFAVGAGAFYSLQRSWLKGDW